MKQFLGKKFSKFFVVMHATALVFDARSLYLIELKKVKSLFVALSNVLISYILIFIDFFVKFSKSSCKLKGPLG